LSPAAVFSRRDHFRDRVYTLKIRYGGIEEKGMKKRVCYWAVVISALVVSSGHAEMYTITDLGTLGGTTSSAYGINDSGQVVGSSSITGGTATHAFLYDAGGMTDLGTLGGTYTTAQGINDSGQVVGYSSTTGNTAPHAFVYDGGIMTDLDALLASADWTLIAAQAINNLGQIAGYGDLNGETHAFLLTPEVVPLPSALLLGAIGMGMAQWRLRKRKTS